MTRAARTSASSSTPLRTPSLPTSSSSPTDASPRDGGGGDGGRRARGLLEVVLAPSRLDADDAFPSTTRGGRDRPWSVVCPRQPTAGTEAVAIRCRSGPRVQAAARSDRSWLGRHLLTSALRLLESRRQSAALPLRCRRPARDRPARRQGRMPKRSLSLRPRTPGLRTEPAVAASPPLRQPDRCPALPRANLRRCRLRIKSRGCSLTEDELGQVRVNGRGSSALLNPRGSQPAGLEHDAAAPGAANAADGPPARR